MKTFINLSNHPSKNWDDKQKTVARKYGVIVDFPFPDVDPELDKKDIELMADNILADVVKLEPECVMCQGEFTLTYALVNKFKKSGIKVVAASNKRDVTVVGDKKISIFKFVNFREY